MGPRYVVYTSLLLAFAVGCRADDDADPQGSGASDEGESGSGPGVDDSTPGESSPDPDDDGGSEDGVGTDSGAGDDDSSGEEPEPGPTQTPGCGLEPGSVLSGEIDVDGSARTYLVELPENYDSDTPYPVVFGFHGSYDSAQGARNGYRLSERWEGQAIVVYPDGEIQPSNNATGWNFSPTGPDFAFFLALYEALGTQLCVDQDRVFSFGYSAGGYMSNALACHRGDILRAVGSISGGAPLGAASCLGPVAAFLVHGETDSTVPISAGEGARSRWQTENACSEGTSPSGREGCVRHEGCAEGYPVVWCTHPEGHTFFGWSADEAVAFFRDLPDID